MITIEKAYYSENTEQIHIVLYNSDPLGISFADAITGVMLGKQHETGEYMYTATHTDTLFDSNYQLHMTISVATQVVPQDLLYPEFAVDGLIKVYVTTIDGDIETIIINLSEFYSYKLQLINNERSESDNIRMNKKMTRFVFYEQMLVTAAESGYIEDAWTYYNELKRMSLYGIPKVKSNNCYI